MSWDNTDKSSDPTWTEMEKSISGGGNLLYEEAGILYEMAGLLYEGDVNNQTTWSNITKN